VLDRSDINKDALPRCGTLGLSRFGNRALAYVAHLTIGTSLELAGHRPSVVMGCLPECLLGSVVVDSVQSVNIIVLGVVSSRDRDIILSPRTSSWKNFHPTQAAGSSVVDSVKNNLSTLLRC
jgi:hypothetical protein